MKETRKPLLHISEPFFSASKGCVIRIYHSQFSIFNSTLELTESRNKTITDAAELASAGFPCVRTLLLLPVSPRPTHFMPIQSLASASEASVVLSDFTKPSTSEMDADRTPDLDSKVVSEHHKKIDRALLIESKIFATESRRASWFCLLTTLAPMGVCGAVAIYSPYWWCCLAASLLMGLLVVRMFILYHDYKHSAIFKDSFVAGSLLDLFGYLILSPPVIWKASHDHHHQHNSQLFGSSIGSFPIMTTKDYANATDSQKFEYRFARHWAVIVFGYFTAFLWGMCVRTFFFEPEASRDSLISLVIHFGSMAALIYFLGWSAAFFLMILPVFIATAIGAYLFYIQHNFPDALIRDTEEWTYAGAALQSSSFVEMSPMMHWFTGNIGYHHVHHLNAKIPFYRLPEAMKALPLLQNPGRTSWRLRDMLSCLRLKLWSEEEKQFVPFP